MKNNKSPVTVVRPFNLGRAYNVANLVRMHPGQGFMSAFLEGLEHRDPKYTCVAPIPIRMLLKYINTLYGEKISLLTGTGALNNICGPFHTFIYDSYINKYGLLNVAERKLKELFLSTALDRSKILKVELFARFIGVSEIRYTTDDLSWLLIAALKLLQKVSNVAYKKREALILEGIKIATAGEALDVLAECMHGYWAEKVVKEVEIALGANARKGAREASLNVDLWCQAVVEAYRKLKREVHQYLADKKLTHKSADYTEIYHDSTEYSAIFHKLGLAESKDAAELFEKCAVFLKEDDEVVKKMCLENILSFLIKAGVVITISDS